jgi:predicted S18 family serine protease
MENTFITDAIDLVSRAIAADNENEYEKALALYRDALARFTMGLKYEKNEARKKLILERVVRFSIRKILDLGGLTCLYSTDHTVPRLVHFC